MSKLKNITSALAINQGLSQLMNSDKKIFIMGEGADDYKGTFGLTLGLVDKFKTKRVMDMPIAEASFTGIAIGSALTGLKPVVIHQRCDFTLLAFDQLINHAAKFKYMFGGSLQIPLTTIAVIGKGWGQGSQHSQSFHSLFAHIPGISVVMPSNAYDAKGLLIKSIRSNKPVIYLINYKTLFEEALVPEQLFEIEFAKANLLTKGTDLTIVALSEMVTQAKSAVDILRKRYQISAELIDLRTISPVDINSIKKSLSKTNKLLILDTSWHFAGFGQVLAGMVSEKLFTYLKKPIKILSLPDVPTPASSKLEKLYYPDVNSIINAARKLLH